MFLLYTKTIFIELYKEINLKINLIYNYFLLGDWGLGITNHIFIII